MKRLGYWLFASCVLLAGCADTSDIVPETNEVVPDDTGTDPSHTPGTAGDELTADGQCEPVSCDGMQVCLQTDPLNCGSCGKICTDNGKCVNGKCEEPPAEIADPIVPEEPVPTEDPIPTDDPVPTEDPIPTDPTPTDPTPTEPTPTEPTPADPTPTEPTPADPTPSDPPPSCTGTVCDGVCVDIATSNSHCGGCGYACGAGLHCVNYNCACSDSALTKCGWNNCVNLKTDPNNCGACGNVCPSGTCNNGSCSGGSTTPVTPSGGGQHVIDYARKFLFTNTNQCTYDLKVNGVMPTLIDLSSLGSLSNYGYDLNCANFVSSVLIDTGEITGLSGREEVAGIRSMCESGMFGYRIIEASKAQAGDIWYKKNDSYSHTELIVKVEGDHFIQIGSNNYGSTEAVGCQRNWSTDAKYSTNPSKYQRIVEHPRALTDGGVVCSKR